MWSKTTQSHKDQNSAGDTRKKSKTNQKHLKCQIQLFLKKGRRELYLVILVTSKTDIKTHLHTGHFLLAGRQTDKGRAGETHRERKGLERMEEELPVGQGDKNRKAAA